MTDCLSAPANHVVGQGLEEQDGDVDLLQLDALLTGNSLRIPDAQTPGQSNAQKPLTPKKRGQAARPAAAAAASPAGGKKKREALAPLALSNQQQPPVAAASAKQPSDISKAPQRRPKFSVYADDPIAAVAAVPIAAFAAVTGPPTKQQAAQSKRAYTAPKVSAAQQISDSKHRLHTQVHNLETKLGLDRLKFTEDEIQLLHDLKLAPSADDATSAWRSIVSSRHPPLIRAALPFVLSRGGPTLFYEGILHRLVKTVGYAEMPDECDAVGRLIIKSLAAKFDIADDVRVAVPTVMRIGDDVFEQFVDLLICRPPGVNPWTYLDQGWLVDQQRARWEAVRGAAKRVKTVGLTLSKCDSMHRLAQACLQDIGELLERAVPPIADVAMPEYSWECERGVCGECSGLQRFLHDPRESALRIELWSKAHRRHLESALERHCDAKDVVYEKEGPKWKRSLVVTKRRQAAPAEVLAAYNQRRHELEGLAALSRDVIASVEKQRSERWREMDV